MTDKVEADTTPEPSSVDMICQATKSFWLRDYKKAVKVLGKVSEMLVQEHGDDKYDGLGNVYLYYGKTLLELVRESGDPLGEHVPKEIGMAVEGSDEEGGSDDDDDDDDDDEEGEDDDGSIDGDESEDDEIEKGDEGENEKGEEEETQVKSKDDNTAEAVAAAPDADKNATDITLNGESASSSQEASKTSSQVSSAEASTSSLVSKESDGAEEEDSGEEECEEDTAEGEKDEEDEEPSDLQLAWEVLELAKQIFLKRGDSGKEDYADCLITLGEVSMENENFEGAIADIRAGLEIQKEIYTEGKDMRKLAHSHYMLGMALCAHNQTAESMTCYETTLRIMKERLALLEALKKPGASDEKEITEIKSLIPEVEEKITDLQNFIDEVGTLDSDKECKNIITWEMINQLEIRN